MNSGSLWSRPSKVDGCSTNGQALAWLTLSESDKNLDINLVQSVGSDVKMSITRGQGGPVMFDITSVPDGTGKGSFSGISQDDFNTMISDGAWLNIASSDCPDGALQGQIHIRRCPKVPGLLNVNCSL